MIKGQRKVRGIRDKLKPGETIGRVATGASKKGSPLILPATFRRQVIDTQVAYTGSNASTYDSVSDAIDGAFSLALTAIPDGDVLANISGGSALPVGNTLTAVLDHVFGNTRGGIIYRSAGSWAFLSAGIAGFFLKTQSTAGDPVWGETVTNVTVSSRFTANGTPGGSITGTGTIDFANIADGDVLANISGGSGAPSATTVTALIDHALGNTQGDILYRNASGWVVLAPGTAGQVLQTGGAGANPSWTTNSSLTTISDGLILSNISGSSALPVGNGLSAIIDHDLGSTQGDILYRNASGWVVLPPGSSGQVLQTGGAGANPSWVNASGGASAHNYSYSLDAGVPLSSALTAVNISGNTAKVENAGIALTVTSTGTQLQLSGWTKAVPVSTPYLVAIHFSIASMNVFARAFAGWSDGTKFDVIGLRLTTSNMTVHETWTNFSTRNSFDTTLNNGVNTGWFGLKDDGTNINMMYSLDGANFVSIFSVAKSSGFLGSSGYTKIAFGLVPESSLGAATFDCYDVNGLSRVAGVIE